MSHTHTHSHSHTHHHHDHSGSTKNIKTAFFLNLLFSIIELVGGIITNSISIISDSVHDFGDAISIGITLGLEKKSNQKPDENYTYGYLRYSVLGAFITSVVLLCGSIVMIVNAVPRIINPTEVNYDGMLILAVVGVFVNGLGAYKTAKGEKISERAVSLHLLEDVLGWIAVLVVSLAIKFFDLPILDPILSLGITAFILVHVVENVKEIFEIFLEKAPKNASISKIKERLKECDDVKNVHHIHIWTADGVRNYATMHALVSDDTTSEKIVQIKHNLKDIFKDEGVEHVTVEIEYETEHCHEHDCAVNGDVED